MDGPIVERGCARELFNSDMPYFLDSIEHSSRDSRTHTPQSLIISLGRYHHDADDSTPVHIAAGNDIPFNLLSEVPSHAALRLVNKNNLSLKSRFQFTER
jgi:hypothetical protein